MRGIKDHISEINESYKTFCELSVGIKENALNIYAWDVLKTHEFIEKGGRFWLS